MARVPLKGDTKCAISDGFAVNCRHQEIIAAVDGLNYFGSYKTPGVGR